MLDTALIQDRTCGDSTGKRTNVHTRRNQGKPDTLSGPGPISLPFPIGGVQTNRLRLMKFEIPGRPWSLLVAAVLVTSGCTSNDRTPESDGGTDDAEQILRTDQPPSVIRDAVEVAVSGLDAMRSGLAGSITSGEEVGAETFAQVCKPVGVTARQLRTMPGMTRPRLTFRRSNPMLRSTVSGFGPSTTAPRAGDISDGSRSSEHAWPATGRRMTALSLSRKSTSTIERTISRRETCGVCTRYLYPIRGRRDRSRV